MSSSYLLYKTRCPKCAENGKDRSGDNFGVYSDGHSYCYSCGFGTAASVVGKLKTKTIKEVKAIPPLPEDITDKLGNEAQAWLLKYFDPKDFPRCLYSSSERRLYFMLGGGAYQYRYLGDNKEIPKWVGYGITESLFYILGSTTSKSICLVEDIISGIKVGHIISTLTLFGSNISLKRLATLKLLGYKEVIIWLDWDKKEYAIKAAQLAQSIGLQTRVIHTRFDPKEFSNDAIEAIINETI